MEGIGEDRGGRGRSKGRLLILGISCRVLLNTFHREIAEHSRSSNHFLGGNHHLLSWSHRVEEGGRRGEGWYHRVEEEGGGERGGPTMRRKRERGRGVVPP